MQSQFNRLASLVVTVFLIVQLFSPAVYAAAPAAPATPATPAIPATPATPAVPASSTPAYTPPAVKDCAVYEISAADREKLWANTMGFLPTEINDLSKAAAVANTNNNLVGTFQNPVTATVVPNVGFPTSTPGAQGEPGDMRVVDAAGILSVDPVEMVNYFCGATAKANANANDDCKKIYLDDKGNVKSDAVIPVVYASAYAESKKKGGGGQFMDAVASFRNLGLLPGSGGLNLPTPTPNPYEVMKLTLPGMTPGKNEYALADLLKSKAVNPDTCVIDSFIQGRVSYEGVLDDDLTYGGLSKDTLSGQYSNPALGGKVDSELTSAVKNQHFTANSMLGYLALNGGSNMLIPSFYERWIEQAKKINDAQFMVAVVETSVGWGVSNSIGKYIAIKEESMKHIRESGELVGRISQSARSIHQVTPGVNTAEEAALRQNANKLTGEVEEMAREQLTQVKQTEAALERYKYFRDSFQKLKNVGTTMVSSSLMLGAAWLGPARLIYEINSGLIVQTNGKINDQYLKVLINKKVATHFKSASSLYGLGSIMELLGKYTGGTITPEKAFNVGPVYLINYPHPNDPGTVASNSETRFITGVETGAGAGAYAVYTNWQGSSYAVNYEYLADPASEKFVSLPLVTNKLLPKASIDQRVNGEAYKALVVIALTLAVSRDVTQALGNTMGLAAAARGFEFAVESKDPSQLGKLDCDADALDELIKRYQWWAVTCPVIQGVATLSVGAFGALTATTSAYFQLLPQLVGGSVQAVSLINPCVLGQTHWSGMAQRYVTNCHDSQYKILTYQQLSEDTKKTSQLSTITQKTQPLTDFLSKLNLGKALQASASPVNNLAAMREILNLKVNMQMQNGLVAPSEITYVHIESSAFALNSRLWDTLKGEGCTGYGENYQSGDKTARLDKEGLSIYDKQGIVKLKFDDYAWRLRALGRLRSQEQARVIIPNKLIETKLDSSTCGTSSFIEVDTKGSPKLTGLPASCNAADCLAKQLEAVTGRKVTTDLLPFLGKVSSIDTSEGIAAVSDGMIRFTRLRGGLVGSETTAPSVADYAATGLSLDGSKLVVNGDGSVVLYGPTGGSAGVDGAPLGTLATIIGERGKIEYDASDGRLLFFAYILATEQKNNLNKIQTRVTKNTLPDGTSVPAIKFDAGEKTGTDSTFSDALKSIQGDNGGMQSWEDENNSFYTWKDPATGQEYLRVVDKKTGVATDYKINGDVTKNADGSITIPTDKGPFTFTFGKDANGNPTLGVTGPDGLKEVLALLAARGQNGIMTFNPSTGAISIYNGQDIPLSPEFAKNGISFTGDGNGNTIGTPQQNLFGQSRVGAAGSGSQSSTQPMTLPSWPSDAFLGALMLVSVLGLVFVIRRRTTFSR